MLKGNILKILSPSKVLINLGRLQGVTKGMKFVIYDEGEMIKDPKTGQDIENLELVKGEIEVTHVQEKMSIAESFVVERRTFSPISMGHPYPTQEVKITRPLTAEKVKETTASELKVGDLIRQMW